MGFHAIRVEDETLDQLTASLPAGKIIATGRGLVPFVKRDLYDKLAGLIGTASELKPERDGVAASSGEATAEGEAIGDAAAKDPKPDAEIGAAAEPEAKAEGNTDPWSAITVGSTILSLRDVQELVGHRSIKTTQGYIEGDGDAQRRLVRLL